MRYLGGKSRYGEQIAQLVKGKPVYEPFCGGLWVTQHLQPIQASDIDENLIILFNAIKKGWEPPDHISEELYSKKRQLANDGVIEPIISFCGYCCSWGGKWFGGYARGDGRNFCLESKKQLLNKIKACRNVNFTHLNYLNLDVKNSVIYCDPPYYNTTSHRKLWDSYQFWKWVREQIKKNNVVYISEYVAPDDFIVVKEWDHFSTGSKVETVERLFKHQSQVSFEDTLLSF